MLFCCSYNLIWSIALFLLLEIKEYLSNYFSSHQLTKLENSLVYELCKSANRPLSHSSIRGRRVEVSADKIQRVYENLQWQQHKNEAEVRIELECEKGLSNPRLRTGHSIKIISLSTNRHLRFLPWRQKKRETPLLVTNGRRPSF